MDSSLFRNNRRPKVVSIPVHFVQSEQTRAASALKIQKAVRGFLVRKCVKQILAIMRDVEEMERWVASEKVQSGIDDKERLRANEKLMSLLLKLDSVRGINSHVRDCRKRVIKKAIALQEKVDSIPKATNSKTPNSVASASVPVDESSNAVADNPTPTSPMEEEEPKTIHCMIDDGVVDPHEQHMPAAGADNSCDGPCDNGHPEVEDEELRSGDGKDVSVLVGKGDEEEEEERDRKRTRELLEKMVEDNERLVGMVTELSQRNEMQTRLLSSLTQRVELLEKALVSEKLARKKKKRHGSS